jgi:hypothetical protein
MELVQGASEPPGRSGSRNQVEASACALSRAASKASSGSKESSRWSAAATCQHDPTPDDKEMTAEVVTA